MATYTVVLLNGTSVPSRHEPHLELPYVFDGSAMAGGGGLTMVFTPVNEASRCWFAADPVRDLRGRHGQRQGPEVHGHPAEGTQSRPRSRTSEELPVLRDPLTISTRAPVRRGLRRGARGPDRGRQ